MAGEGVVRAAGEGLVTGYEERGNKSEASSPTSSSLISTN